MFLKAIQFKNYRQFQDAELPLSRLTVLVGANGTGKTTALSALKVMKNIQSFDLNQAVPLGVDFTTGFSGTIDAVWTDGPVTRFSLRQPKQVTFLPTQDNGELRVRKLSTARVFSLVPERIATPVPLTDTLELTDDGGNLPSVITTLRDKFPERFDLLNRDLGHWLPDFNYILLTTPATGQRGISLRTSVGNHPVQAQHLSHGTLLSLAMLTMCYLPTPPAIIGLEEPDRGVHPRLLRSLKDSLLRLTQPDAFGDDRPPIQVILTTHSPYLVDLFSDDLESVVVLNKVGLESTFKRLSEMPNVDEILAGSNLGDAWYSGILGGVPSQP